MMELRKAELFQFKEIRLMISNCNRLGQNIFGDPAVAEYFCDVCKKPNLVDITLTGLFNGIRKKKEMLRR